ncbi:hypothetical protein V8F20_001828 [Naviculisporaceae sp. PSN 640]
MVDTFRYMKCSVITRHIDSKNFDTTLEKFLDRRFRKPRLIWVNCHGGETPKGLRLSAGPKSNASIYWSDLVKTIASAQVDVLTVLSSCYAAAAYIPQHVKGRMYAKELLALTSWNEGLYPNIYFDPTFAAMRKWFDEAGESRLTGEKLYQYVASGIRHARMAATKKWTDHIEGWERQRKGRAYSSWRIEEEVAKGRENLKDTKRYYPHPIFTKRYIEWEEDMVAALTLSDKEERSWSLSLPVPAEQKKELAPETRALEILTQLVAALESAPKQRGTISLMTDRSGKLEVGLGLE